MRLHLAEFSIDKNMSDCVSCFSTIHFTYCISSIEGFQPNYCSDILGNTRFSLKHDIAFVFCV